jgi:hypothetical protein
MRQILLEIFVAVVGGVIVWWLTQFSELSPRSEPPEFLSLPDLPSGRPSPEFPIPPPDSPWPSSPNGQYRVAQVGGGKNIHYQIKEVKTGRILLTTHAQYNTPNDVKVGVFSPDLQEFAAAYHYGHDKRYTWIGIWDIQTGNFLREERQKGWSRNISWVFN